MNKQGKDSEPAKTLVKSLPKPFVPASKKLNEAENSTVNNLGTFEATPYYNYNTYGALITEQRRQQMQYEDMIKKQYEDMNSMTLSNDGGAKNE